MESINYARCIPMMTISVNMEINNFLRYIKIQHFTNKKYLLPAQYSGSKRFEDFKIKRI